MLARRDLEDLRIRRPLYTSIHLNNHDLHRHWIRSFRVDILTRRSNLPGNLLLNKLIHVLTTYID